MESLTSEVQAVFQNFVSTKGGWLSDATKALANAKIEKIVHSIGYPDFILDDNLLEKEVKEVSIKFKYNRFYSFILVIAHLNYLEYKDALIIFSWNTKTTNFSKMFCKISEEHGKKK